jgi:hypothetical protein
MMLLLLGFLMGWLIRLQAQVNRLSRLAPGVHLWNPVVCVEVDGPQKHLVAKSLGLPPFEKPVLDGRRPK